MTLGSWPKIAACIFVVLCVTILGALGRVSEAIIASTYTGVLGYVFGNGHGVIAARQSFAHDAPEVFGRLYGTRSTDPGFNKEPGDRS